MADDPKGVFSDNLVTVLPDEPNVLRCRPGAHAASSRVRSDDASGGRIPEIGQRRDISDAWRRMPRMTWQNRCHLNRSSSVITDSAAPQPLLGPAGPAGRPNINFEATENTKEHKAFVNSVFFVAKNNL